QAALRAAAEQQLRLLAAEHTREQAAHAQAEVDRAVGALRDARAAVRGASPQLAVPGARAVETQAIQAGLLEADTVLLEYSLGERRSFLWALTHSSLSTHELPPRPVIERLARSVYEQLSTDDAGHGASNLAALGQLLLGPVAGQLTGRRVVV